jgi:hypothetical protein
MATKDVDGGSGLMKVLKQQALSRKRKVEDLDIKHEIGVTSGEIYKFLERKGEIKLKDVRANVRLKGPLFAAALGWLMREDKIALRVVKDGILIKLR